MNWQRLENLLRAQALRPLGGIHIQSDLDPDLAQAGFQTLILLGPDEPNFWPIFERSEEFSLAENPMDRWSKRVINALAKDLNGQGIFPSDGPPYAPFFSWALRSERCHTSPINMLVHDQAGLMVSFRGALALREIIELPAPPPSPCESCAARPCETACPVAALTPEGYEVARCKSHIASEARQICMSGCLARLACPVSQRFGRDPAQSQFHMKAFLAP